MRKILTAILLLLVSTAYAGKYTYQQNGVVTFGWLTSDELALFTQSGTMTRFKAENVYEDKHYMLTKNTVIALVYNSTYYACSPYIRQHLLDQDPYTALPITYANQTQLYNDYSRHLAQVDYMTAHGTTGSTAAPLELNYTHLGAIIRIAAYVPEGKTFTSLTLTARDDTQWFTAEATMNATNNTMTPTATAATATLALDNITVEAGDSLIAYLMTAPANLSENSMQLSLYANDGSALQTYLSGCNIQAGKAYSLSVGRENYFRTPQQTTSGDDDTEEVLSLSLNVEEEITSDDQITTATAYATDFTTDATAKMKAFLLGDVNLDGTVDVTDAVLIINHYQSRTTELLDFNVSDVNGDSVIDVTDAVGIINIYQSRMQ